MSLELRTIHPGERDAVLDLLAEWLGDRAFFARYFQHDAQFRDDLCFVAVDDGRPISTFQVFRKPVRLHGATVQVGGVGNVFTTPAYRERHLASQLLQMGLEAMRHHGFDLSLLFAVRLKFYAALGWQSHVRHLVYLEPSGAQVEAGYELRPFADGDLPAVQAIYDAYNLRRSGTVVRDDAYWRGQLQYAGNPHEHFVVAQRHGEVVAYARGTPLYDFFVIMEHGCHTGHQSALAQLTTHLHGGPASGLPGTLTQLAFEPAVVQQLEAAGIATRQIEDVFWMWRVLAPQQLADKLRLPIDDVERDDFLQRVLPPTNSVYWIADRF